MFIRDAFIASLLGIFGYAGAAYANSCSNLDVIGTYDQSGLQENESGIFAVGTFRIEKEENESKQPMFNLAFVNCEKQTDDAIQSNLRETTTRVLASLTPREERILRMRFGIGMNSDHTLEEVGHKFSVTRERIRQIEAKALRKLKHPTRSRVLRSFLDN